jgi:hypothetical protein
MAKNFSVQRSEYRVPMEVAVQVAGHPEIPGVEMTFTENVSSRGARVLSSRRWRQNERLALASLAGSFRAQARVAYCEKAPGRGFAVGVEFQSPEGQWVIQPTGQDAALPKSA